MSREREIFEDHVAKVVMNTEDFFYRRLGECKWII